MRFLKGGTILSLLAAAVAIVLLASGCGSSEPAAAENNDAVPQISEAAKNLDPCSLLSKADVQDVTGQPVNEPDRQGTSCNYDSYGAGSFGNVTVIAQPGTRNDFDYMRKVTGQNQVTEIQDLGDMAAWLADNKLMVQKKDILITMTGYGAVGHDSLQQLAQKAVSNVPGA